MSHYDLKPWLMLYPEGQSQSIAPEFTNLLSIFLAAVRRAGQKTAIKYFDGAITYNELDRLSGILATDLLRRDVEPGDRIALLLQNTPHFVIGVLAAWKIGAIATPVNPMNRERELAILFGDCAPKVIICHPGQCGLVSAVLQGNPALGETSVITASAHRFQTREDRRVLADEAAVCADLDSLGSSTAVELLSSLPVEADIAFLVYTSGTTGVPKGAMITHANAAFNAQVYRDWMGVEEGGGVLGLAPLFHVTGLIGHIAAAFMAAAPLVLTFRFEPNVMLDSATEHRPQFVIGAITAFIALMNAPSARREQLSSLTSVYSGGAAIPPAVVEEFRKTFGLYIHNGYGLTETTSPSHAVPRGIEAPVDPVSGALAIGVPVFDTSVRIEDEAGRPAPVGEYGEIVTKGPMVIPGYWNKPVATSETINNGWLHTGDIGFMDEAGWFYLVDRKKDMINASGFKVWPREIEDVLYTHPAIREAAVVGVHDPYRGETVKAVVSLKPGFSLEADELIEFSKKLMAAYKYPRLVEIIDELPKTPTGKILRRELRQSL